MISTYLDVIPVLLRGLNVTVTVLFGSALLSFAIAFITGFGRLSKRRWLSRFNTVFVEFFRGTSLLVQMFWIYFSLPIPAYWAGVIAIGLNYGSYMSEVVRGSILAVPQGQTEASVALNMTSFQRMRFVILPQAFRMMLPEFGNYLIQMLKATSLVYMISLGDITYHSMVYRNSFPNLSFETLSALLLLYFVLALPLIALVRWLERLAAKGVVKS